MSVRKPALIISAWLIIALFFPAVLVFLMHRSIDVRSGLVIVRPNGRRNESTIEGALSSLQDKDSQIHTYIWIPDGQTRRLAVAPYLNLRLRIGDIKISSAPHQYWTLSKTTFSPGAYRARLILQDVPVKKDMRIPSGIYWTENMARLEIVPDTNFFVSPLSENTILRLNLLRKLGILLRLNLFLTVPFILIVLFLKRVHLRIPGVLMILTILCWISMFFIRIYGVTYYADEGIHPDERLVQNSANRILKGDSPPKKYFWAQGFAYITAGAQALGESIYRTPLTPHVIPRTLAALFSTLSSVIVFFIMRHHFSQGVSFSASILSGFSYMPIYLAHFGIVESAMVFFFLLVFLLIVRLPIVPTNSMFAICGLLTGFAVAIKQTAALIVIPFLLQYWMIYRNHALRIFALRRLILSGVAAIAGYFILAPHSLVNFRSVFYYQIWQLGRVSGEIENPFFADAEGKSPTFLVLNYLVEGLGYPLLIAAALGCFLIWKRARRLAVLLVPFVLLYLFICSAAKMTAYHFALLLCPFAAMLSAVTISEISRRGQKTAATLILFLLLTPSLLRTSDLVQVYQQEDTRRRAAIWCYENLQTGSKVDWELFGPRFLIHQFHDSKLPLFRRAPWEEHLTSRKPHYYVMDGLTTELFRQKGASIFPVESHWLDEITKDGVLLKEFHGRRIGLYNPDIRIYKLKRVKSDDPHGSLSNAPGQNAGRNERDNRKSRRRLRRSAHS